MRVNGVGHQPKQPYEQVKIFPLDRPDAVPQPCEEQGFVRILRRGERSLAAACVA